MSTMGEVARWPCVRELTFQWDRQDGDHGETCRSREGRSLTEPEASRTELRVNHRDTRGKSFLSRGKERPE